ncbi:MAG: ATP-grasp fold amidoligase family protein [Dehalococcoidales bacterium]
MKRKIKKIIANPKIILLVVLNHKFFRLLPDKIYLAAKYRIVFGRRLNFDKPQTFNEKLQWIKIYDRKPEYTTYADKYAVRKYVKQTIGEECLVPLYGVYGKVDEIPWEKLPKQFVLKCTHASGANIICHDKSQLDIKDSNRKLQKWMAENWYWCGREWPYKNIKPQIICEKYLGEGNCIPDDYKVMCFNGKAKLIEVHKGRFEKIHTQDYYNTKWEKTEISQVSTPLNASIHSKPACLHEMLYFSELLSRNTYHVRIDWYVIEGSLYFGEITFFDASGLDPFAQEEHDILLGSWIHLPIDKRV